MRRNELGELHYITPIINLPAILARGILSHRLAATIQHESVADPNIQDRRVRVLVPGGQPLHNYANLYIHARNPMLRRVAAEHMRLCVLRVRTNVLELPGVVVADRNASSDYVRFGPAPAALATVDSELVFAEYWTHPDDLIAEWRHKSIKCAEILVPDRVDARFIVGAYVSCAQSLAEIGRVAPMLPATVDSHLFFR